MRNRAERRRFDEKKAMRKYRLYRSIYPSNREWADYLKNIGLNIYSKGKIHCSCPMCSGKAKYRGSSIPDKRKIASMKEDLEENDMPENLIKDRYERGW